MNGSFDKGSNSIDEGHGKKCAFNPKHIGHEILTQLFIEVIKQEITTNTPRKNKVEEKGKPYNPHLITKVKGEHCL
jgi:hypothetical protein